MIMKITKLFNKIAVLANRLRQRFNYQTLKSVFKHRQEYSDNFQKFSEQEGGEWRHFRYGRESFQKYLKHSVRIFRDYFIPYEDNDHRPKILRLKSLSFIALILIFFKLAFFSYIFLIYTQEAKMSVETINRLLALTNEERVANNLEPLSLNSVLSRAAQAKAEDMVINNYFSHFSPNGAKPWDWISRDDYPYLLVGENLAMNFSSVESAQAALMASPTHKQNILNSRYEDVGLALISGKINNQEGLILVELFAVKKAVAAAPPLIPERIIETPATPIMAEKKSITTATPAIVKKPIIKTLEPEIIVPKILTPAQVIPTEPKLSQEQKQSDLPVITEINSGAEVREVIGITTGTVAVLESQPEVAPDIATGGPLISSAELNQQASYIQPESIQRLGAAALLIKISRFVYALALEIGRAHV